ncbi:Uncharacterized protein APZ42_012333 [Daphnia magna]|uniref:Uncharacterized protein n=1 Tax=Daphnia magna TaxID=35525 RepID=A0A162RYP7_9CRUS|nr:Uncharacterized protein APZ42_012333 [Daphnia magna]
MIASNDHNVLLPYLLQLNSSFTLPLPCLEANSTVDDSAQFHFDFHAKLFHIRRSNFQNTRCIHGPI